MKALTFTCQIQVDRISRRNPANEVAELVTIINQVLADRFMDHQPQIMGFDESTIEIHTQP
jgi:hypothetical protein